MRPRAEVWSHLPFETCEPALLMCTLASGLTGQVNPPLANRPIQLCACGPACYCMLSGYCTTPVLLLSHVVGLLQHCWSQRLPPPILPDPQPALPHHSPLTALITTPVLPLARVAGLPRHRRLQRLPPLLPPPSGPRPPTARPLPSPACAPSGTTAAHVTAHKATTCMWVECGNLVMEYISKC